MDESTVLDYPEPAGRAARVLAEAGDPGVVAAPGSDAHLPQGHEHLGRLQERRQRRRADAQVHGGKGVTWDQG